MREKKEDALIEEHLRAEKKVSVLSVRKASACPKELRWPSWMVRPSSVNNAHTDACERGIVPGEGRGTSSSLLEDGGAGQGKNVFLAPCQALSQAPLTNTFSLATISHSFTESQSIQRLSSLSTVRLAPRQQRHDLATLGPL